MQSNFVFCRKKRAKVTLNEIKACINENECLDLSNLDLTSSQAEDIIHKILDPNSQLGSISSLDFSANNMDDLPYNFVALIRFMEAKDCSKLNIQDNGFNRATMETILEALQCRNSTDSLDLTLFNQGLISTAQYQQFLCNSMLELIYEVDPHKELRDDKGLNNSLVEYFTTLTEQYVMIINSGSVDDETTKLKCLVAKDPYDFNPSLLQRQIANLCDEYYAPSPLSSKHKMN